MKSPGAHPAVANVSDRDNRLFLHSRAEQHAGHHRNHVAEMRNRTDKSFLHIAEVNIEIASTRRSPGFRHVLREDFARPNAFNQAPRPDRESGE